MKTIFTTFAVLAAAVSITTVAHADPPTVGSVHQECDVNMQRAAQNLPRFSDKPTPSERGTEQAKSIGEYGKNLVEQGGRCLQSGVNQITGAGRGE